MVRRLALADDDEIVVCNVVTIIDIVRGSGRGLRGETCRDVVIAVAAGLFPGRRVEHDDVIVMDGLGVMIDGNDLGRLDGRFDDAQRQIGRAHV